MDEKQACRRIEAAIVPTREDVARAKQWLARNPDGDVASLADRWLSEHGHAAPSSLDLAAADCEERLDQVARVFGVRVAFFQAVWELVAACELIATEPATEWRPGLAFSNNGYRGGLDLFRNRKVYHPRMIARAWSGPTDATDVDLFLGGVECHALHPGIREAIAQALACFQRGLYMPSIAMLAAAAEATWTECGIAVASHLGNTKLENLINEPHVGVGRKVSEIRRVLEQPDGKTLLKRAVRSASLLLDAENWTTTLRDRRNALHWNKAKNFVAEHSDCGILLMAAPRHLDTLEAIREACG